MQDGPAKVKPKMQDGRAKQCKMADQKLKNKYARRSSKS
jgi:hypothetical protein